MEGARDDEVNLIVIDKKNNRKDEVLQSQTIVSDLDTGKGVQATNDPPFRSN